MARETVRPYLIAKGDDGAFRITVRTTRFNSQGYPLVSAKLLDDSFPTLAKARVFAREQFRAEAADIATK